MEQGLLLLYQQRETEHFKLNLHKRRKYVCVHVTARDWFDQFYGRERNTDKLVN